MCTYKNAVHVGFGTMPAQMCIGGGGWRVGGREFLVRIQWLRRTYWILVNSRFSRHMNTAAARLT